MPTITLVVPPEKFRDEELLQPREAFEQKGYTVQTVSMRTGEGEGMMGHKETFTQTLNDVNISQLDALVIVGGFGSVQHLWDNKDLHLLVQTAVDANKLVAAICVSPAVLAKAGVLQGKKAAVYDMPESQEAFKAGGATFTGEPVTIDGRIITANGPEAAKDFADAIINALEKQPVSAS